MKRIIKFRQTKIERAARTPSNILKLVDLQKRLPGEITKLFNEYKKLSESKDHKNKEKLARIKNIVIRYNQLEKQIDRILSKK